MILNALKFLAKIRGNHKIVKKETNSISISVFGYEKKENSHFIITKILRKNLLLLIEEKGKR